MRSEEEIREAISDHEADQISCLLEGEKREAKEHGIVAHALRWVVREEEETRDLG